ncbi:DUF4129 domain-containing protein [Kitasatospora sp. NBC_01287]|uniref:DUF4129 domain-containing protein n=1 Tax=Kitasatospora sp. NBC_01287 TaxID=2903573 RepID=UPI002256801F|nr:DUF4129 domain-containing protein [Kitasatospora sp. NBC_01287]MCX4745511.1 DUF4129 domain-containing protein [Kitasatospora sp. NBC_01287]
MTAGGDPGPVALPGAGRPGAQEAARAAQLRRVLAVGAVAGLAFAALELRPDSGLLSGGDGPLSRPFLPLLLLALGWLVLLERTLRRYRGQLGRADRLSARADRLRAAALRLLPVLAVGLPVLLLLLRHWTPTHSSPPEEAPTAPLPPHLAEGGSDPLGFLKPVALVLLALLLAVGAVRVWRLLRRLPKPRLPHGATTRTRTDERELARAIASARRALLNAHDARTAVIACYLAMEDSLAASGIERRIADSPTDLLHRATTTGTLHGPAATTLTDLFREARYSQHPMDHTHLHHARTALDTIATQLDAQLDAAAAQDERQGTAGPAPDSGQARTGRTTR